ncbi:MAG: glutamate racemase [Candidatus Riflebacteria bacterium]|nr:glutamate racemase [Candidatus Riflebacteria bacterium]
MDERPIGVFDSGVGGLTVVKEIRAILPTEDIVYFGDTARVPYGNKSIPVIRRFCLEIVNFLETMKVKMIVIACNTASALALDHVRRNTVLPVIGVIDPGVRAALRKAPSVNDREKKIGVIGTRATIKSEAYQKRLKRLDSGCSVFAKPCPLFVPIVEENLSDSIIAEQTLNMYLDEFRSLSLDALILACTHYPLLKKSLDIFFDKKVILIDSAEETALEVAEILKAHRISAPSERNGTDEFYVSDSPESFMLVGSQFLKHPLDKVFLEPVWQRTSEK